MVQEEINPQAYSEAKRVLLIDLENCPAQINQLQHYLKQFSQVIICYARTGAKIPLDWLLPLSTAVTANRLKVFKMTSAGKNAADFGICFFAGMLVQDLSPDTHFVIISNDQDLDHVVNLLKSQGRTAERVGSPKEEPATSGISSEKTNEQVAIASPIKVYCAHLITYCKNRPAKKDTLLNSIKNKFKETSVIPQDVLETLVGQGAVKVAENKVSYDDKKIKELAQQ